MFGMGGSEILVILIVALLFLGPDKLPQAAKSISKGIRDIKKQSRSLQQQIESDEQIGGAIRDIKSALRGEELPARRPPPPRPPATLPAATPDEPATPKPPAVTLPPTAGESDANADLNGEADEADDEEELASMIRPADGTVPKGSDPGHG